MTPEQEKAALDRLRPLQRWVASPGPSLPAAVGAINAQLRADKQQLKGARRKGLARASLLPCSRANRQLRSTECLSMFRVLFLAATAAALAGCAGSESATQAKVQG